MSSYQRQQLEDWLKTISLPAQSKVLDIGGSQLPVKGRLGNKGEASTFQILDLESPHEEKQKPDIVCDLNEVEEIHTALNDNPSCWGEPKIKGTLATNFKETFDVIFCLEVSEYLWNPFRAFRNINYFLKSGGLLYASFHFIYPVHNPVEQDYIRYTPRGVEKLLEESGFRIQEMQPRYLSTPQAYQGDIVGLEGMRPARNYDKHHWAGCLVKAIKI